jgi:DNA polymerase-3 subunit chi
VTRVDFYSLQENSGADRFLLTCRLVERIHGEGHRIFIHVPDREQARHLDRLLWTFRQQSFLPHGLLDDSDPVLTPILIGTEGNRGQEHQILVNLALEVPDFFGSFERLCEPVDLDPAVRSAARERFAYYRDRGYPLHHHQLRL